MTTVANAKNSSEKHIHKFKRLKFKSGNMIFFCALPDCNQKINISLALGKRSICWRCGQPFIMTEYSLRLAKPHCENCHKPKKEFHDSVNNDGDGNRRPIPPPILSLSERLQQTIEKIQEVEDEEI